MANVNPNIFRMYDIRGIADEDLTDDAVTLIGKAYGTYMIRKGYRSFSVGRDVRLSSERIKNALITGMTATGCDVVDIGIVPTPVLYFSIVHLNTDGGIMVTGSHNPIEFNGLKMCEGLASVYGEEIQRLRELIEHEDFETGKGRASEKDIVDEYVAVIKSKIKINKKLKIVVDAGNGTAGVIAPQLWEDLGCEVDRMYCEPDGHFPNHMPDPTVPKYVKDLQKRVLETGADMGIGYDGDSDRMGIIDEKGNMIFADKFLALFSKDVLKKHPGATIIFDVKCSQALPEYIKKYGGKPIMWKTGHAILKAKMKEEKSLLAGEMSGHIFFADDYYGFDDAIYVSGRFMQIVANSNSTVSDLIDDIPHFIGTPEIRVDCADEDKFRVVDDLVNYFKEQYETLDIDGARVMFGDGWGLVRASNTQPVLVLRFEARTKDKLRDIIKVFTTQLKKYPSVHFSEKDFNIDNVK
ncbi:phosphomannomutase/phosphoglucomutase [candidate division KSB1 bacterium]|nr:phosphomannomutase/phosphoglucomutase [candidate division KSB1 bacterium]